MHRPTIDRGRERTHPGDAQWWSYLPLQFPVVQCRRVGEEEGWHSPILYRLLMTE